MSETPGAQSDEPSSDSRPSTGDAAAAADAENQDVDMAPTSQVNASEAPEGEDAYGSRTHGKRLTTKEEVSLFEICNRYAASFGERNKLCEWWKTVRDEFTREQEHPYSWHSVRRRVEVVTKQRLKFLAEQKVNGRPDMSNPQWREVVDAWIPTWERFEKSERKRIEVRDTRRGRKRKDRSSDILPWQPVPERWTFSSPVNNTTTSSAPAPTPTHVPTFQTPPGVRLPAGYDTMFSGQRQPPVTQPQTPLVGIRDDAASADSSPTVTSALLETLSKLNKHLDLAVSQQHTSSSPVVTALAAAAVAAADNMPSGESEETPHTDDVNGAAAAAAHASSSSPSVPPHTTLSASELAKLKQELKEELRKEFVEELKKDRAPLEEKLDSIQQTQEIILEMLRQEPQ
jgi:hypothetical protein